MTNGDTYYQKPWWLYDDLTVNPNDPIDFYVTGLNRWEPIMPTDDIIPVVIKETPSEKWLRLERSRLS